MHPGLKAVCIQGRLPKATGNAPAGGDALLGRGGDRRRPSHPRGRTLVPHSPPVHSLHPVCPLVHSLHRGCPLVHSLHLGCPLATAVRCQQSAVNSQQSAFSTRVLLTTYGLSELRTYVLMYIQAWRRSMGYRAQCIYSPSVCSRGWARRRTRAPPSAGKLVVSWPVGKVGKG